MTGSATEIPVLVFAKAPVPGQVKTRLVPELGEDGAAQLYRHFVTRALHTATRAGTGPVELWCSPDHRHPFFRECRDRFGVGVKDQITGDLGQRMAHATAACLAGARAVLLIGSDCPALEPGHLRQAAEALREGGDVVLIPAEDGGYVLVGMRQAHPELFRDIPWGSGEVLKLTRQALRERGLGWSEPATLWDVDRPADLLRLAGDPALSRLLPPENRTFP